MQTISEVQRANDEGSNLVRTFFFNQHFAQSSNEALIFQQKRLQDQYERLQRICKNKKQACLAAQAAVPVLDTTDYSPVIKSINKITTATDNLLQEVKAHAHSHAEDINTLKALSYDLEITSNLLSLPTEQNLSIVQARTSLSTGYPKKQGILDAMLTIGEYVALAAAVVAVTASLAAMTIGICSTGVPLFAAVLATAALAYSVTFTGCLFNGAVMVAQKFVKEEHCVLSQQKTIADEIDQKKYVTPPPSFGM